MPAAICCSRLKVPLTAADDASEREARATFARCRELFEEIQGLGVGEGRCNLLSMGMSNDYEAAVKEGANIVRVGSAIFGAPARPDTPEEPEPEEPDEDL